MYKLLITGVVRLCWVWCWR